MQLMDPQLQELILTGRKPRELYAVRCLIKFYPDVRDISQVQVALHDWRMFADDHDDAIRIFEANKPSEVELPDGEQLPIEIIGCVFCGPHSGPVDEKSMLQVRPSIVKAVN